MAIRQREQQRKDAQLLYEYRQRLRDATLETFTDKPDPVTQIRICNATSSALAFEWIEPNANNSEISGYSVIIDDTCVSKGIVEPFYEAEGLKPDTCYKV